MARTDVDAAGAVATRTALATIPSLATRAGLTRVWQRRNPLRGVAQR